MSTKTSISKKCNNFLNSRYAFSILSLIVIVGIINVVSFASGIPISTYWGVFYFNGPQSYIGWIEIIISTLGSLFTIFGVILAIRFDKRFLTPLIIGELLVIIDSIIVGYWLTTFSYILMICFAIYNYVIWNKEDNKTSGMNARIYIILLFSLLIYILIGTVIYWQTDQLDQPLKILDIFASGIVTFSWFIILRKSKVGFIGFVITDIIYILMYLVPGGTYATVASYFIYLVIDSISLISWWESN